MTNGIGPRLEPGDIIALYCHDDVESIAQITKTIDIFCLSAITSDGPGRTTKYYSQDPLRAIYEMASAGIVPKGIAKLCETTGNAVTANLGAQAVLRWVRTGETTDHAE